MNRESMTEPAFGSIGDCVQRREVGIIENAVAPSPPMKPTLLEQFLTEEGTPYVRGLVRAALDAGNAGTAPARNRFEFHRFEVTLDVEDGVVLIDDILNPSDSGVQRIPLQEFSAALAKQPG